MAKTAEIAEIAAAPEANNRTIKNFRTSPDVENFFRFVHENGLRAEAKMVLDAICLAQKPVKKRRKRRTKNKIQ